MFSPPHVILLQRAKFRHNQAIQSMAGLWRHIDFTRWRP